MVSCMHKRVLAEFVHVQTKFGNFGATKRDFDQHPVVMEDDLRADTDVPEYIEGDFYV